MPTEFVDQESDPLEVRRLFELEQMTFEQIRLIEFNGLLFMCKSTIPHSHGLGPYEFGQT